MFWLQLETFRELCLKTQTSKDKAEEQRRAASANLTKIEREIERANLSEAVAAARAGIAKEKVSWRHTVREQSSHEVGWILTNTHTHTGLLRPIVIILCRFVSGGYGQG